MKRCTICKTMKPLQDFHRSNKHSDGRQYRCKPCHNESQKIYNRANPEKNKEFKRKQYKRNPDLYRDRQLIMNFGITRDDYNKMHEKQKGLCAICGNPETSIHQSGKIRQLAVDHCHKTGKVRGLLCGNCNKGIGNLQENPEIILQAASYVAMGGV